MNKRKCSEDDADKEDDEEDILESSSIPLPIQVFLWSQTRYNHLMISIYDLTLKQ